MITNVTETVHLDLGEYHAILGNVDDLYRSALKEEIARLKGSDAVLLDIKEPWAKTVNACVLKLKHLKRSTSAPFLYVVNMAKQQGYMPCPQKMYFQMALRVKNDPSFLPVGSRLLLATDLIKHHYGRFALVITKPHPGSVAIEAIQVDHLTVEPKDLLVFTYDAKKVSKSLT